MNLSRCLALTATLPCLVLSLVAQTKESDNKLVLESRKDARGISLVGTLEVPENRDRPDKRSIRLRIVVLKALSESPKPDPIFFLAGGPGQAATQLANGWTNSWMRRERDIVFVDQRGTGQSNPLHVELPGSDDDPQGYLENIWQPEIFERARKKLERKADLTQYTTPIAMDDLNDVRIALGYDKINLTGGSYGTRAALVYMRRHENTVRTALLQGVAPPSFINPLYHAWAAQRALDMIFERCESDPKYRKEFSNLRGKFQEILARLEEKPAKVEMRHPGRRSETITIHLSRANFVGALRILMYYDGRARTIPTLLLRAHQGDFRAFAQSALQSNRGLRNSLAFGMLMSVVGTEDIPRIEEEAIERETKGTFLGPGRILSQRAVSKLWPRGVVSDNYGDPVQTKTQTLIISGTRDPVTPPRFGQKAADHLVNSVHLVVPGAHEGKGGNPCIRSIIERFLEDGSVENLDVRCVERIQDAPLHLPRRI